MVSTYSFLASRAGAISEEHIMASWRHVVIGAVAVAGLNACAVAGTDWDSGTDGSASDVRTDTPRTDTGARDGSSGGRDVVFSLDSGGGGGTSPLLGRCTAAADCADMGAGCLTVFPGGMCTKACTTDGQCNGGRCVNLGTQSLCLARCSSGGGECNTVGGACVPIDAAGTSLACVPSCFTSGAPSGFPACIGGTSCDSWTGGCGTSASTGADNGAACAADADCRGGRCITELNMSGAASGWLGGYCLSFGLYADIMNGAPVPQSNCPPGSGAVPLNNEMTGDSVPCFKICSSDAQCRPGFHCDHLQTSTGSPFFSNGICFPNDCLAGMSCPTGTHCVTMTPTTGMPYGVCAH